MPSAPPRPCTKAGCTKYATIKGRCDAHQIKHGWNHTKSASQRGYGADWRRIKKGILLRDSYLCQACLREGVYTNANEVDHITPKSKGGSNHHSNLESICVPHHKIKTQREAKEARDNG